jgi:hypothetical protein
VSGLSSAIVTYGPAFLTLAFSVAMADCTARMAWLPDTKAGAPSVTQAAQGAGRLDGHTLQAVTPPTTSRAAAEIASARLRRAPSRLMAATGGRSSSFSVRFGVGTGSLPCRSASSQLLTGYSCAARVIQKSSTSLQRVSASAISRHRSASARSSERPSLAEYGAIWCSSSAI